MITDVTSENMQASDTYIAIAGVDLLGEILGGDRPKFQRGVTHYPTIGDTVDLITQPGTAHGLCALRRRPDQCRHAAAGPLGHRLCRRRGNAVQAFRRARLDRRRQIDRRVAAAQRNPESAAEPAHLPARRPQRIWPLLRRPRAGAQPAQPETAVLAVQLRGNRRRAVRRPPRRARGARHPRRSDSDGEGHLHPIPERRPHRAEAHRSQADRLHRRHAGAVPAAGPGLADRRAHGQAGEPLLAHHLSQADLAHRHRARTIRATPSCSTMPMSAATPWRK